MAAHGTRAAAGDAGGRHAAEWIARLADRTLRAFHQGLAEGGYVEGRNVVFEYRWAEDRDEQIPQLAAELVERGVSVITAVGSPAVAAAKGATTAIPIVFYVGVDPVLFRLVSSFSRPEAI